MSKNLIKRIAGWIILIATILLALYTGVWLLFAGGIIQIVNSINPLEGIGIAIGIIKIIVAAPVGWCIALFGMVFGLGLIADADGDYYE